MSGLVQAILILGVMLGFAGMEIATRRAHAFGATPDDGKLELAMFVSLLLITQPAIVLATNALCAWLVPQARGALATLPWWGMAGLLLIGDDLTQYWWHRISHTPRLWPLHRAHHTAHYMSIRITYRNNFFYYAMMPGLWISGVLAYLGAGPVLLVYYVVKLTVILGAHCAWRWDAPLYRIRALRPALWVAERVISTPATHWAHHALTNTDGIGHYTGNFGNLLFFWDVLFGTAKFTRRYPAKVGLKDDLIHGKERWFVEAFYPLLQSQRPESALRFGGQAYDEVQTVSDAG
jgi:sterol desaturase/sphingolipid hydroxylase (fatty acid hydroxylase superfamily)